MNDILNRLTVLLAMIAFAIVAIIGFINGVQSMVALLRATIALLFFGLLGRLGFRVILKGIFEELARHKEEQEKARHEALKKENDNKVSGTTATNA